MNSRNIIGIALVAVAASLIWGITSSVGESAVRLCGKAVWYLPYVALVGSVRFFRAA